MSYDLDKIRSSTPLAEHIAGRGVNLVKDGREFKACCPFHSEDTPSFTVFKGRKGERFHCFGCGAKGDVLDFEMAWSGVGLQEAAQILGGERQAGPPPVRRQLAAPHDPYEGFAIKLPPADAPELAPGQRTPRLLNPKREGDKPWTSYTPSLVHALRLADGRLLGYVLRVDIDGKKLTPVILWGVNEAAGFRGWMHGVLPEPRPLYGLDELARRPKAQVLVVEGEKCKDAAQRLLPELVVVSWIGGGKAYEKTNWSHLAGRSVLTWPDADEPGRQTMEGREGHRGLHELLLEVGVERLKTITPPADAPQGWDVADAEADGWDRERVLAFMRANVSTVERHAIQERRSTATPTRGQDPKPASDPGGGEARPAARTVAQEKPRAEPSPKDQEENRPRPLGGNVVALPGGPTHLPELDPEDLPVAARYVMATTGGRVKKSWQNFMVALEYEPAFQGLFAWDEMTGQVLLTRRPPWERGPFRERPFADGDAVRLAGVLEKQLGLTPRPNEAGQVAETVSHTNQVHRLREHLASLQWDGVPRLQAGMWEGERVLPWLSEYAEAPDTELVRVFGMRWMIAAAARVFRPGCKADNMLILEGNQGGGKSALLRTIGTIGGACYYTDGLNDLQNKDAQLVMRGMLIAEIAELSAMKRGDVDGTKAWITRQVDRFRPPYGKAIVEVPRTCVLAGTINPEGVGYLKDVTGNRRYWPVPVGKVDVARLERDVPQLWAEAVHLFNQGEQWWLTDEEAEQAKDLVGKRRQAEPWAEAIDLAIENRSFMACSAILDAIGIPRAQQSDMAQRRVANYLHELGWKPRQERDAETGKNRRGWRRPA